MKLLADRNAPAQKALNGRTAVAALAGTAMWAYFSYFGTSTLLLLSLQSQLNTEGWESSVIGFPTLRVWLRAVTGLDTNYALAAQITGLFLGFLHLTPLPGGWLADRVLGRNRAVYVGGFIMAAGHGFLAFDRTFLIGLLCLVCGAGLFEPTLAARVVDVPARDHVEKQTAYYVYYAAINVGGLLAPLVVGTAGERLGWHFGFAIAAAGMIIALGTYRFLSARIVNPADVKKASFVNEEPTQSATRESRKIVMGLVGIAAIMVGFRIAYWQQSIAFVFWLRDHTDRHLGSFEIPVTWFQAVNPTVILLGAPLLAMVWATASRHQWEMGPLYKMAIGCVVLAIANVILGGAALSQSGLVSWSWSILYIILLTVGELLSVPVGLTLFALAAPERFRSALIGLWYVATFLGSVIGGFAAGLWQAIGPANFWFLMAGISLFTAILLALMSHLFPSLSLGIASKRR